MADSLRLAYFMAVKEGGSYLGGLLVTDSGGIPLDFRYTEPITPTKLQSVLYGKALEPHLKEEVIQKTLLKELKTAPDVLVVLPGELAGGAGSDLKCPVVAMQRSQEAALPKLGETFRVGPRELLLQVAEGAAPLRLVFGQPQDLASQEPIARQLLEAAYHMDLTEPMDRVAAALQSLVKGE